MWTLTVLYTAALRSSSLVQDHRHRDWTFLIMGESHSSNQAEIEQDFLLPDLRTDGAKAYLQQISEVVSKHCRSEITLKHVEQRRFVVGTLDVTAYRDEPDVFKEWEQFYLPDHMFMRVIGCLKNFPCNELSEELVLMVCEDGKVFAYEDEKLHLVAKSLKGLFEQGVEFPSAKQYYRGERFKNMMDSDWDRVKKVEKLAEHQETLTKLKESYLMGMNHLRQNQHRVKNQSQLLSQ